MNEMYIPDFEEIGERQIEKYFDELKYDGETIMCHLCGDRVLLDDCTSLTSNPYSPPICPECADYERPIAKQNRAKR